MKRLTFSIKANDEDIKSFASFLLKNMNEAENINCYETGEDNCFRLIVGLRRHVDKQEYRKLMADIVIATINFSGSVDFVLKSAKMF